MCHHPQKAEREAKQLIYRLKRENSNGLVVVTGCSATYWQKHKILKNLPIDILVGNVNKEFLVKILQKRLSGHAGHNPLKTIIYDKYLNSGRALIKIQDGCQRFCSFCIVPYLRGTPKSERIKDLVRQLADKNLEGRINEVILTAINTGTYGYDTGETLVQLINTILTNSTIPRISFGSIHPWSINDEFLDYYKKVMPLKRLVNFFHVPIQSGSNKILNLMKRSYTREEMMEKLNQLHRINPLALIATDVIVGFLDECEKDFQDTYDFLEKSPISKFHIFRFSKRDSTAAYYMAKNLKEPSQAKKMKRAKLLANLGKNKYQSFLKKNVGGTSKVLFLNNKFEGYQEALLDNQLPIYIKVTKPIQLTAACLPAGRLYEAKILEYKKNKLFGRII